MADFPGSVYSPRVKENKPGVIYDAAKSKICFVEDVTKLDAEVVAIETFLSPKLKEADIDLFLTKKAAVDPPGETSEAGFPTFDFDAGKLESIFYLWHLPAGYKNEGEIHFHFHFFVDAPEGSNTIVKWQIQYKKKSDGDVFEFASPLLTDAQETIDSGESNKIIHSTEDIELVTTGFNLGDSILFKFFRDGGVAPDDFGSDARLLKIHVLYESDKLGETIP